MANSFVTGSRVRWVGGSRPPKTLILGTIVQEPPQQVGWYEIKWDDGLTTTNPEHDLAPQYKPARIVGNELRLEE